MEIRYADVLHILTYDMNPWFDSYQSKLSLAANDLAIYQIFSASLLRIMGGCDT